MKTLMAASILALLSNGAMAEGWENPDLYDGIGAVAVTNVANNFNDNPDLYGNGMGEDEPSVDAHLAASIDQDDPNQTGGNPDLYGAVISTSCFS